MQIIFIGYVISQIYIVTSHTSLRDPDYLLMRDHNGVRAGLNEPQVNYKGTTYEVSLIQSFQPLVLYRYFYIPFLHIGPSCLISPFKETIRPEEPRYHYGSWCRVVTYYRYNGGDIADLLIFDFIFNLPIVIALYFINKSQAKVYTIYLIALILFISFLCWLLNFMFMNSNLAIG